VSLETLLMKVKVFDIERLVYPMESKRNGQVGD